MADFPTVTPIDRIREQYRLHPQEQPFEFYLNWHLHNGFVFSTPEFFVMGRAIDYIDGNEQLAQTLIDKLAVCIGGKGNCWYVHAMAGDMGKAWGILPYPLGWIAFERVREGRRELTRLPIERMRRLTHEFTTEMATPCVS